MGITNKIRVIERVFIPRDKALLFCKMASDEPLFQLTIQMRGAGSEPRGVAPQPRPDMYALKQQVAVCVWLH